MILTRMDAFSSLTVLALPSPCRLLATSCSPDKDLIALISRYVGQDRVSLWKYSGTKIWEADVDSSDADIPAIAWSPDGAVHIDQVVLVVSLRLVLVFRPNHRCRVQSSPHFHSIDPRRQRRARALRAYLEFCTNSWSLVVQV